MNAYEVARATLFRAMLGEKPIPTAEEVVQAKILLNHSPEFRAGLDDLVNVVLLDKHPLEDHWRSRLQAYVAAQLAGAPSTAEFAEIKQRLDADVAFSEEYALLYETMQHEQQGTLPMPLAAPAPKLDFLSAARKTPTQPVPKLAWLPTLSRLKLIPSRAFFGSHLFGFDRLGQQAAVLFLCIALLLGLWRVAHPTNREQVDHAMKSVEDRSQSSAFFKSQMELETSSPAIMMTQFYETPQVVSECSQLRQTSFARNICKI